MGGSLVDTLREWIGRVHDESWPWNPINSITEQYERHPTFLVAEVLFIGATLLAAWHSCTTDAKRPCCSSHIGQQSLKLLWLLTFIAGIANDYIFMLMPMVDNFWQAQAVLMLTPRMPLYIPCVYNAFMYWSCVAAWRVCRDSKSVSRLAEACLAALLGAVLYAPYDICGARFLWWTWHLDDAGVKMRWAGNEPLEGMLGSIMEGITSANVKTTSGVAAVPGGGVPAGSTAWTLVFNFCFAYFLRFSFDNKFGNASTVALVAGLSTFSMMALLTPLCAVAGDRMGMPGPNTLLLTISLMVAGCAYGGLTKSSGKLDRSKEPLADRLFVVVFFTVLTMVMLFGKPEDQISTGVHQPFALNGCSAEDLDMIKYRRLKYTCQDPPLHLPMVSDGESIPWHARGWAHDAQVLPKVHHPHENFQFDCTRSGLSGLIPPEKLAVDKGNGEGPLSSWYSLCGVPSSNARGLAWVALLGLMGSFAYLWAFSCGRTTSEETMVDEVEEEASAMASTPKVSKKSLENKTELRERKHSLHPCPHETAAEQVKD